METMDETQMDAMLRRDPGDTLDSAYGYVCMELEEEGINPSTIQAMFLLSSLVQAVGWERRLGIAHGGGRTDA